MSAPNYNIKRSGGEVYNWNDQLYTKLYLKQKRRECAFLYEILQLIGSMNFRAQF